MGEGREEASKQEKAPAEEAVGGHVPHGTGVRATSGQASLGKLSTQIKRAQPPRAQALCR